MARTPKTTMPSRQRRTGQIAAVVAVVLVVAVGAVVYTNSRSTEQVVNQAGALQAAEATLGAADLHLKSLSQVALLAADASLGVADDAIVAAAIDEVDTASSRLETAADRLSESVADAIPVRPLFDASDDILEAADEGRSVDAATLLTERAAPAHAAVVEVVTEVRDTLTDDLTAAGTTSGRWSRVAGFLTAFFVPLIAMAAYRQVIQRQLRLARVQLETRIAAERELTMAKDHFIADISHELRTPLTSIYGFSEVLLDDDHSDPDATKDLVQLINRESGELARMVEDLLVAAREPESELILEPIDVKIEDLLADIVHTMGRSGVEVDLVAEDAVVICDSLRLRQILRNLLSNCRRYGGSRIRIVGERSDAGYVIDVQDDGRGVPKEMVPRLFTRFVHADGHAVTSGSVGLGLAVAERLATAMGGSLDYARRGRWTTFTVTLPISDADEPPLGWPSEVPASA
ncbi:MAG: HAMP domain-containing sensor histidine kinase [Acidimicrobiia bacterium]|nr:HAMP domain-containing sensor histidine kinase [Acidimicrobiia bacterium]